MATRGSCSPTPSRSPSASDCGASSRRHCRSRTTATRTSAQRGSSRRRSSAAPLGSRANPAPSCSLATAHMPRLVSVPLSAGHAVQLLAEQCFDPHTYGAGSSRPPGVSEHAVPAIRARVQRRPRGGRLCHARADERRMSRRGFRPLVTASDAGCGQTLPCCRVGSRAKVPSHGGTHVVPQHVEAHFHPGGQSRCRRRRPHGDRRRGSCPSRCHCPRRRPRRCRCRPGPGRRRSRCGSPQTQSPLPMHTSGTVVSVDDVVRAGSHSPQPTPSTTARPAPSTPPHRRLRPSSRSPAGGHPSVLLSIAGPLCQLDADPSHRTELPERTISARSSWQHSTAGRRRQGITDQPTEAWASARRRSDAARRTALGLGALEQRTRPGIRCR